MRRGFLPPSLPVSLYDQITSGAATLAEARAALIASGRVRNDGAPTPSPGPTPTPLPAFSYDAKTTAASNAMAAKGFTPSAPYQRFMDAQFRRLDAAGITPHIAQLWIAQPQDVLLNLVSPGVNDPVKVGAPTWTSPVAAIGASNPLGRVIGYSTTSDADYIETNIQYGSLNPADFVMGFYRAYAAPGAGFDMGAIDGSGGLLMVAQSTDNSNTLAARIFSASMGLNGTSNDWDGANFHAVRGSSDGRSTWHNATKVSTKTGITTVLPATPTRTIHQLKANGIAGTSAGGHLAGVTVRKGLTDSQMRILYSIIRTWVEEVIWGAVDFHEPGYAPAQTAFDGIAYGLTAQNVCIAIEAKRQGLSVAMVGGWNETSRTHIGGMSANGLGEFDVDHPESVGGVMRTLITRARAVDDATDSTLKFNPGSMNKVMRQELARLGIPIYATGAMPTCTRSNGLFNLATGDGRRFTSSYLEDNSYEGDALASLGVPLVQGREAAGASGIDAVIGGFRGTVAGNGGNINQFATNPTAPGTLWPVDPFNTPGDENSGLIAGVAGPMPTIPVGSATNETQSYNFRITLTDRKAQQIPWDQFFGGVPPEGYSPAKYEALKRQAALQAAAGGAMVLRDLLKVSPLYKGKTDCNNQGGMSTDLMGSGTAYVAAGRDPVSRLQVLKDVRNNILGLFYDVLYSNDARYPAALVTSLRALGFADDHYLNPGVNDVRFFPGCLYVREHSRLASGVGGAFWTANDAATADGAAPRISANTVSAASYALDSHHMQRYWATIGGVKKLWLEGNMFAPMGGSDGIAPVPAEITAPDPSVMPNVSTAWSVACNHNAFGTYRMEGCSGQAAQCHGAAWAVAKSRGVTVQAALTTHYADVKALMAASPDAVKPYLPANT